jgi:hypothetical protein
MTSYIRLVEKRQRTHCYHLLWVFRGIQLTTLAHERNDGHAEIVAAGV